MKISEVIEELAKIKADKGDIYIYSDIDGCLDPVTSLKVIEHHLNPKYDFRRNNPIVSSDLVFCSCT